MVLIEWREEYCTGIKGIDYEHEKLIDQINATYALIDNKADKQRVIDSLGDIYGAISAHFALEEQVMKKYGYAHYEEHKADHERLLNDIGDITEDFENTVQLDETAFKQLLADWFQLHFGTHDFRMHQLANLMPHDRVDEATMKTLIQNAKNKLSRRMEQQS
ncbi:MAG: hemerythrin family protein [Gammaproteobacteria bacterium]